MIYNGQITELLFKKKAFRFSSKGFLILFPWMAYGGSFVVLRLQNPNSFMGDLDYAARLEDN